MRNLVREHINEKFVEDSDPIKDLGIGLKVHRNFTDEKKFMDFLLNVIFPSLIGPIPKDILSSGGIIRSDIFIEIENYLAAYITINGIQATNTASILGHSYWNSALRAELLKRGFKDKTE